MGLGLALPLYVHPVLAPEAWEQAQRLDYGAGFLVLNVADGPGERPDPAFVAVVAALTARRVPLVGYVDTAYGERDGAAVGRDVDAWAAWYGVEGVFLDQVPTSAQGLRRMTALAGQVRRAGAARVVMNPGVLPPSGLWALADVVVSFEGPWSAYRGPFRAVRPEVDAVRVCHLVHSLPDQEAVSSTQERAASGGAGLLGLSLAGLPNPWVRVTVFQETVSAVMTTE